MSQATPRERGREGGRGGWREVEVVVVVVGAFVLMKIVMALCFTVLDFGFRKPLHEFV